MPWTSLGLVRTLHVIAAALTLGSLAAVPLIRGRLENAPDVRIVRRGLGYVRAVERWVLIPSAIALLGFGLAMVEGPLSAFSFTAPNAGWLHIGTTLWMVLAGAIAAMIYHRRQLDEMAQQGATGGSRVGKLWRRWTLSAVAGILTVAGGVAVMGMKLGA
jgi:uncharacterized membrane protein